MNSTVLSLVPLLLFSCSAGAALGVFFFGGLWWTIRKSTSFEHPALLFPASLLLRTLVVMAGLYLVSQRDWRRLVAGLLGFIVARFLVTRLTRQRAGVKVALIEEGVL